MIIALLLISTAFLWLLRETDYLRVRLPVGKIAVIPAAQFPMIPVESVEPLPVEQTEVIEAEPIAEVIPEATLTRTMFSETLKETIKSLSKQELEISEVVKVYDN